MPPHRCAQASHLQLSKSDPFLTQHVLLDDVFSAVDSHTAKKLLETLLGPILRGRSTILVTHHEDLVLSGAAYRIELAEGLIVSQGVPAIDHGDGAGHDSFTVTPASRDEPVVDSKDDEPPTLVEAEGWTTGEVKRSIYTTCVSHVGNLAQADRLSMQVPTSLELLALGRSPSSHAWATSLCLPRAVLATK